LLKIDATNGLRIGHGTDDPVVAIDASGNASFTGEVTATSGDVTGALAAGSITTDKLAVGGMGAALNDDPSTSNLASWTNVGVGSISIASVTDGQVGTTTLRSGTGLASAFVGSRFVSIDPAKTYRVHAWARKSSTANGTLFLGLQIRDASGANVTSPAGTYWYVAASGQSGSTSWTEYVGTIGPASTTSFPSNGRTMAPLGLLNFGGSAGYFEVQDVRLEEVLPGTLIQDGVVTTDKLAANAVTAAKIAAGTITATQIAASTITAAKIASDTITSSQIAANAITSSELAANAVTAAKIAAGTITADKMNVTSLSAMSANLGTVTAGTINGVTINGSTLNAGSAVTLDDDGISIVAGTSTDNRIRWSDGSQVYSDASGLLRLYSAGTGVEIHADDSGPVFLNGGTTTITSLAGTGTRQICATSTGTLVVCP
jgi:hypothetical protein